MATGEDSEGARQIDRFFVAGDFWYSGVIASAPEGTCDTYWGSHGCRFPRGHEQPCECSCYRLTAEEQAEVDRGEWVNVGGPPYYGPGTNFRGDDAATANHPTGG